MTSDSLGDCTPDFVRFYVEFQLSLRYNVEKLSRSFKNGNGFCIGVILKFEFGGGEALILKLPMIRDYSNSLFQT